ncbi:hypothetical protein ASG87_02100 [Frateuria sp. Soil773]|uniref:hypothetical protein n=1 Tax=Frateuria sp. Soil773 TaxID=1736407 RepID=UPI0006F242CC|nr:hypothetical protein [Frateuria sp. Soil773]KRE90948.1 hypothetical protein ASG87_02100 [Frateuria sp. Soil773]
MNRDPHFPLEDAAAEREWQRQERAMRQERAGLAPADGEPDLHAYRQVARALAEPPRERLPADFARLTARRAERAAAGLADDGRFEQRLVVLLLAVFALAGVIAAAMYGRAWLPAIDDGIPAAWLTNRWLLALAVCLGCSGLLGHWRPGSRGRG